AAAARLPAVGGGGGRADSGDGRHPPRFLRGAGPARSAAADRRPNSRPLGPRPGRRARAGRAVAGAGAMSRASAPLTDPHLPLIRRFLSGGEEAALEKAYELGRTALSDGLMRLVAAHHEAVESAVRTAGSTQERLRVLQAGAVILTESLAVVEMSLR